MLKNAILSLMLAIALLAVFPAGIQSLRAGEDSAIADPQVLVGEWTHGLFSGDVRTARIESWLPGASYTGGYYFGANGLLIHVYGGPGKETVGVGRMTATYRVDGDRLLLTDIAESRRGVLDRSETSADKPQPGAVRYFRVTKGENGTLQLAIADNSQDLEQAILYKKRKPAPDSPSTTQGIALSKETEAVVGAWRYKNRTPEHVYGKPLPAYTGVKHYAAMHTFAPDGAYTHVYSGSGPNATGSGIEIARFRVEGNRIHFTESFVEHYDPNLPGKSFRNRGIPNRTEYFEIRVNDTGESQFGMEQTAAILKNPHPWFARITDESGAVAQAEEHPRAEELLGAWRSGTVNPDLPYDATLDKGQGYAGAFVAFQPDGTWVNVLTRANPVLKIGARQTAKYRVEENRIYLTECREDRMDGKVPAMSYKNKALPDTTLFFKIRTNDAGGKQITFGNSELALDRTMSWLDADAKDQPAGK